MNKVAPHRVKPVVLVLGIVSVVGYFIYALIRPYPVLHPNLSSSTILSPPTSSQVIWPSVGQSAYSINNDRDILTHGEHTPVPTASTAKLITALLVLQVKPLTVADPGPNITLAANDEALYNNYASEQGSVVAVKAGQLLTERQMLEGMLLPSANNFADSLAIWAYGSLVAYKSAANDYLAKNNLTSTRVGDDASGYAPNTVSNAHDLIVIGKLALAEPVIAQIVNQKAIDNFPLAGTLKNVNSLLGEAGIVGIKTGNTDQAGGVFVAAAKININTKPITLFTSLAASTNLYSALKESSTLVKSLESDYQTTRIVSKNQIVGSYRLPWGGQISAISKNDLNQVEWNGKKVTGNIELKPLISSKHEYPNIAGVITTNATTLSDRQQLQIFLSNQPKKPPYWWLLSHPLSR
ncbi:MAG: hypothetical protein NVS1B10_04830 [Candidatus Saccharimonadales bacterium]